MNVVGAVLALAAAAAGVVVLIFRVRIAAWNARVTSRTFGDYGKRVARNSTPAWITIVGIGLILVGVVGVLRVLFPGTA